MYCDNNKGLLINLKRKSSILKAKSSSGAILLSFLFFLSTASAQESLNATGGNASGSGGSASYSIGQLSYQTIIGSNGSATQGVQQPYEISVVTAITEAIGIKLTVLAYPNPTTDNLILETPDFHLFLFSFFLYDMNGKLLQNNNISARLTTIDMSNLVPGSYFVKVIQGKKEVKTFKIIKN